MNTLKASPDKLTDSHVVAVGHALASARHSKRLTGAALAAQLHICRRTLVKMEQGDPSVALKTYRATARALGLPWAFELLAASTAATDTLPNTYLSGRSALSLPHGRASSPLWYTHALSKPEAWQFAGRDLASTSHLLGVLGVFDATSRLAELGVRTPGTWAASYERAVFDLLHHHCECLKKPVPNLQAEDIDDVVNLDQVAVWITQLVPFISNQGQAAMRRWLELRT